MNSRKPINKHNKHNQTAERLATKAILINGSVRDGLTTYSYNPDTKLLTVSDGTTTDIYEPIIMDSDLIFPFAKLKRVEVQ